jgi:hypothetical protein
MRLRRNTISGLVVIVAVSGVVAAVAVAMSAALYGGRDNPFLGVELVVASVGALSWVRMAGELERRHAAGDPLNRWAKARLLLASLGFALVTIGFSGVTFLAVLALIVGLEWNLPYVSLSRRSELPMLILAIPAATVAGVAVGSLVRWAFSRAGSPRNQSPSIDKFTDSFSLRGAGEKRFDFRDAEAFDPTQARGAIESKRRIPGGDLP